MIFIESGGHLDGHRQASEDANEAEKNGKGTVDLIVNSKIVSLRNSKD